VNACFGIFFIASLPLSNVDFTSPLEDEISREAHFSLKY
jgi:hypothetical protein